jgi:hypothetical protein
VSLQYEQASGSNGARPRRSWRGSEQSRRPAHDLTVLRYDADRHSRGVGARLALLQASTNLAPGPERLHRRGDRQPGARQSVAMMISHHTKHHIVRGLR